MTASAAIVISPLFQRHAEPLSSAITLDLAVSAPFLYWLAGGKRRTAIRLFVVGLLLAGLLLHGKPHPLLDQLRKWVSPVVEAGVLFLLVRGIARARRRRSNGQGDFLELGRPVLAEALGSVRAADVLISEFAVFYYLFAGPGKLVGQTFSYHRRNGIRSVLYAFVFCIVAETAGVHFLVGHFSGPTAWVLTGLGVYTLLQLLAHCRAIRTRPILLDDGRLYLHNGLVGDVSVALDDIAEIRVMTQREARLAGGPNAKNEMRLGLLKAFESPNIRLTLRRPATVYRPFGIRKEAAVILFYVDEPEMLAAAIRTSPGN